MRRPGSLPHRITRRAALAGAARALGLSSLGAAWLAAADENPPGEDSDAVEESTGIGASWPCRVLQTTPPAGERRIPVVTAIEVLPNEGLLVSAGDDHAIYLWDLAEGCVVDRLRGHRDWVQAAAYSATSGLLATAGNDQRVILWDLAKRVAVHEFNESRHALTHLTWSRDGRWLAGIGFAECVRIYDVENRQLARVLQCPDVDLRAIALSPDDRVLVAGGRNGVLRFWSMPEGRHVLDVRPHQRRVRAIVFSPEGDYLASAGEDRLIHVHPMRGNEEGFDLSAGNAKVLSATFYGPHHLATGGADNRIRLWDLAQGKEIGSLAGHSGSVARLASSGSLLVSGSYDTTIRLWTIVPNLARDRKGPLDENTRR